MSHGFIWKHVRVGNRTLNFPSHVYLLNLFKTLGFFLSWSKWVRVSGKFDVVSLPQTQPPILSAMWGCLYSMPVKVNTQLTSLICPVHLEIHLYSACTPFKWSTG